MEQGICQMVSPRFGAIQDIVYEICKGDHRPVAHFTGGREVVFLNQFGEIVETLDQGAVYNSVIIIVYKTVFKGICIDDDGKESDKYYCCEVRRPGCM